MGLTRKIVRRGERRLRCYLEATSLGASEARILSKRELLRSGSVGTKPQVAVGHTGIVARISNYSMAGPRSPSQAHNHGKEAKDVCAIQRVLRHRRKIDCSSIARSASLFRAS